MRSLSSVGEYLAKRAPALAADEGLVRALHDLTDGLPLLVADVVKDLIDHEEGALGGASSALHRVRSMVLPETFAGVIERYIEQLSAPERMVLDAASACGAQFRLATLARVLERDVASVAEVCAELACQQHWLAEQPPAQDAAAEAAYAFRHTLYRGVLYRRIAPLTRARLHRKVAHALERERDAGASVGASELRFHFEQGRDLTTPRHYAVERAQMLRERTSATVAQAVEATRRSRAVLQGDATPAL